MRCDTSTEMSKGTLILSATVYQCICSHHMPLLAMTILHALHPRQQRREPSSPLFAICQTACTWKSCRPSTSQDYDMKSGAALVALEGYGGASFATQTRAGRTRLAPSTLARRAPSASPKACALTPRWGYHHHNGQHRRRHHLRRAPPGSTPPSPSGRRPRRARPRAQRPNLTSDSSRRPRRAPTTSRRPRCSPATPTRERATSSGCSNMSHSWTCAWKRWRCAWERWSSNCRPTGAQTGMAQAAGGSATDGSGGRPLATVTSVQGRRRHAEHPAAVGSRVPRWIACQK